MSNWACKRKTKQSRVWECKIVWCVKLYQIFWKVQPLTSAIHSWSYFVQSLACYLSDAPIKQFSFRRNILTLLLLIFYTNLSIMQFSFRQNILTLLLLIYSIEIFFFNSISLLKSISATFKILLKRLPNKFIWLLINFLYRSKISLNIISYYKNLTFTSINVIL